MFIVFTLCSKGTTSLYSSFLFDYQYSGTFRFLCYAFFTKLLNLHFFLLKKHYTENDAVLY